MKTTRLAAAVVLAFAGGAYADPPGPAPGNELNPAPVNPATAGRPKDADGMGEREPAARSPTGRLYDRPPQSSLDERPKDAWSVRGFIDAGGMAVQGDKDNARFRQYKDVTNGLYVSSFLLAAERPDVALYYEATGGAVGMNDQFYRVQGGRYNEWKVTAFYDETPHTETSGFRSLWNGVGTGNLTLAALAPGGTASAAVTQANVRNALAATPESTLGTTRRNAGLRGDWRFSDHWKAYATFTDQQREGARGLGAIYNNVNLMVAEPIDQSTHDVVAGLQFNDATSSFNLRGLASFFHNDIDTLTFQNPLFVTPSGTSGLTAARFTQGRFDLAPDNQHYNVKGEYARALPWWRGSFTATAAVGTMRQDDALVAPTTLDLTGGTVSAGGVPLAAGQWNTVDSLSQRTAKTRIDTRMADMKLAVRPASALDVRGELRFYETVNHSHYIACNPLTGQWGRLLSDGSALSLLTASTASGVNPAGTSANAFNNTACSLDALRALPLVPTAGNVPLASAPYDQRQTTGTVSADWRVGRASSINGSIERDYVDRDFRERAQTWEDRLKLGYVDRGLLEGTLRLTYEHDRRSGSDYIVNAYTGFRSSGYGALPSGGAIGVPSWFQSIGQFRNFDLADRNQDQLVARVDHSFMPGLDGGATLRFKDAAYPGQYGRTGHQRNAGATLDFTWLVGASGALTGFYAFEGSRMQQRGVQPDSCTIGSTYYFLSDGRVLTAAAGAPVPATPPGTTLLATRQVTGTNWPDLCGMAAPTSPLFTTSRTWDVTSEDRNQTVGLGFRWEFARARLDTNLMRTLGRTKIAYGFDAAAFGFNATQLGLIGSGLPDMQFAQTILDASVVVPLSPTVAMRGLVRYESGRIRDWHYDGIADNPMPAATQLYLDSGPRDYRATIFGLFFLVRL